jgi:ketosteroid isomerase-like protein
VRQQPVRQRLSAITQPRRAFDERLALRFPQLAAFEGRMISKLPPSSRVRQAVLARSAGLSIAAYNRRDIAAIAAGCQPDYEYHPAQHWVEAGLVDACYRGAEGHRRYVSMVDQVWGGENHLVPLEVIDLGDRVLLLADGVMRAQASGVPLNEQFALLATLKDGRPVRLQEYYDHAEALRLVGLEGAG